MYGEDNKHMNIKLLDEITHTRSIQQRLVIKTNVETVISVWTRSHIQQKLRHAIIHPHTNVKLFQ